MKSSFPLHGIDVFKNQLDNVIDFSPGIDSMESMPSGVLIQTKSRKLKSHYGARNRFQEPSLELSSQATQAGGPVRQPYAYLVPSPHSGTKVTDTVILLHCKDTVRKTCNKYFHKRNCSAPVPFHVSVSDLYIPTVDLPILLQENIWTDPGNI